MTWHNTAVCDVRARKPHSCSWCSEKIHAGEVYKKWTCIGDDGPLSTKMHAECHAAMGRWTEAQPGEYEYDSGSFTRGCVCESGDCGHGTYPECAFAGRRWTPPNTQTTGQTPKEK